MHQTGAPYLEAWDFWEAAAQRSLLAANSLPLGSAGKRQRWLAGTLSWCAWGRGESCRCPCLPTSCRHPTLIPCISQTPSTPCLLHNPPASHRHTLSSNPTHPAPISSPQALITHSPLQSSWHRPLSTHNSLAEPLALDASAFALDATSSTHCWNSVTSPLKIRICWHQQNQIQIQKDLRGGMMCKVCKHLP